MVHRRRCSISASVLGWGNSPYICLSWSSTVSSLIPCGPDLRRRSAGDTAGVIPICWRKKRYDRGAVEGSRPATQMMLLLKRTEEQESSLQSYLQQIQSPTSVNFTATGLESAKERYRPLPRRVVNGRFTPPANGEDMERSPSS
jgi:hypothetical protein